MSCSSIASKTIFGSSDHCVISVRNQSVGIFEQVATANLSKYKVACRGNADKSMANWMAAVGLWEGQMMRRIFAAWKAQGSKEMLKALGHWEATQSGLGSFFRWWRRVVQHLHEADCQAEQHRQQHACRAAFQARLLHCLYKEALDFSLCMWCSRGSSCSQMFFSMLVLHNDLAMVIFGGHYQWKTCHTRSQTID